MSTVNEQHRKHLSQLDKILTRIYNNGANQATYLEIFKNKPDTEISKMVAIFFTNPSDPELEALKYLINEGLVLKNGENYSLTFNGILKTHTNTFVEEYLKSVETNLLIKRDLVWKFRYNIIALCLSGIAIIVSLLTAYLRCKC